MKNIIGREREIELLKQYINSSKSEFIAVYGRRRVGKTYLIDQLLRKDFAFSLTGIIDGKKDAQMAALKIGWMLSRNSENFCNQKLTATKSASCSSTNFRASITKARPS